MTAGEQRVNKRKHKWIARHEGKKETYVQQPKEVQFPMVFGAVGGEGGA